MLINDDINLKILLMTQYDIKEAVNILTIQIK